MCNVRYIRPVRCPIHLLLVCTPYSVETLPCSTIICSRSLTEQQQYYGYSKQKSPHLIDSSQLKNILNILLGSNLSLANTDWTTLCNSNLLWINLSSSRQSFRRKVYLAPTNLLLEPDRSMILNRYALPWSEILSFKVSTSTSLVCVENISSTMSSLLFLSLYHLPVDTQLTISLKDAVQLCSDAPPSYSTYLDAGLCSKF